MLQPGRRHESRVLPKVHKHRTAAVRRQPSRVRVRRRQLLHTLRAVVVHLQPATPLCQHAQMPPPRMYARSGTRREYGWCSTWAGVSRGSAAGAPPPVYKGIQGVCVRGHGAQLAMHARGRLTGSGRTACPNPAAAGTTTGHSRRAAWPPCCCRRPLPCCSAVAPPTAQLAPTTSPPPPHLQGAPHSRT